MARCVIVGAGELNCTAIRLSEGDICIAADAGILHCLRLGLDPDLVIGDFDSLGEKDPSILLRWRRGKREDQLITLPVMKDDTDMMAAARWGLSKGYREFCLYGCLGGRLSHTMANLETLNFLKEQGADGRILEDHVQVRVIRDETVHYPKDARGYFSVFSVGEKAEGVTIRGMKYNVEGVTLTDHFPIGASNAFVGRESSVTVERGRLLLIWEMPREA